MFEPSLLKIFRGMPASKQAGSAALSLAERYRGVMLGVAVGNILGLPAEGSWKGSLLHRFPTGLRDPDPAEAHRPWDDDLAQTVLLAESLLDGGPLNLDDLAERLLKWARENGRGMGNLTWRALNELAHGTPPVEAGLWVWIEDGRGPAGNGAVMRCAPISLRWRHDIRRLVEESLRSALVTHFDPRCQWSAVAFNLALAYCLEGMAMDVTALADALDEAGAPSVVGDAIRVVKGASLEALDLDEEHAKGYTLKAMQVGLWALNQTIGFENTLVAVVNEAGDTDTNGAVVGAAAGALYGDRAIPERWLVCVNERERLEGLADRLLEASQQEL